MLVKDEYLSSAIWQYCEYTYYNTLRANMPRCNMEPSAISRPQSRVYMSHGSLRGADSPVRS
jgi:hypothetical protein